MTKPARDRERDRALKNRSKSREPGVDHAHASTRFQIGDDLREEQKPPNVVEPVDHFRVRSRHNSVIIPRGKSLSYR